MTVDTPVHVAGWLRPWWEFWAGITAAVYWPAIGTLLSSTAIGATIYLADRGRREARRKEESLLLGLAEALETVVDYHEMIIAGLNEENFVKELAIHRKVAMASHFGEVFDQVKISEMPTPQAAGIFVTIRAWLRRHDDDVQVWQKLKFDESKENFRISLNILIASRSHLISEANRVTSEYGLKHILRKSIREATSRNKDRNDGR